MIRTKGTSYAQRIRKAAPSEVGVVVGRVVLLGRGTDVVIQVGVDSVLLVPRSRKVRAETAAATVPSPFWVEELRTTYSRDVRTCTGKLRSEPRLHRSDIVPTYGSNTFVTRGLEDSPPTQAHHANHVADPLGVLLWHSILVVTVAVGDDVWQVSVLLREQVLVIRQIRLVRIVRLIR